MNNNNNNPIRPSASLYVGNLASEVTEATLFEIFNQVGPVGSIRVCRDAITRRSLGYAYVNFIRLEDAERALDTLNYSSIKGRPCRIMWSQRDPSLRRSGQGNIFIKNLEKTIDNKTLHDTFSEFGNILSCKVMIDENGNSRGFGFVHFESPEVADQAINQVNGMLLNDKKVFVGHHISKRERYSKYEEMKKNFTNVFVKNLDESVDTDDKLKELFTQYGEIVSAAVMKDENGKSKGFGFVNFSTHEEATKACEGLNETEINGKKLFVGRHQKKAERREELMRKHEAQRQERLSKYQGVNLFIKNLDDTIDDAKLRTEFAPYGTITSSKIVADDKGISKGFGFVCYSSPEEATKAVTEMNGRMLGSKPIYVALAQRREFRRQYLEAQHAQRHQMRLAQQSGLLGPMYGQPIFYGVPMAPPPHAAGRQQFGLYPGPPQMMGGQRPRFPPQPGGPMPQQGEMGGYMGAPGPRGPPRTPTGAPNSRSRAPQAGGPAGGPSRMAANGMQPGQAMPQGGARKPGQGYRMMGNVRNQNQPRMEAMPMQMPVPAGPMDPSQEILTSSHLAELPPAEQKQVIGERLYNQIYPLQGEPAGKITGMLLEMDNSELLHLLEHPDSLRAKVEEALLVLAEAESQI